MMTSMQHDYDIYLKAPWAGLVVLTLAGLSLSVVFGGGLAGGLYYALVLASLVSLMMPGYRALGRGRMEWPVWRELFLAGAVFLILMLVVAASQGGGPDSGFEKTLRFLMLLPLVLLLRQFDPRHLRHCQWVMLGMALALGWLLIFPPAVMGTRPDTVQYSRYNTVEFGNLTALFAALSLFSCAWTITRYRRWEIALKLAVGLVAAYGFVQSETRTGWLALPVFLFIGLVMLPRYSTRLRLAALVLGLVAAVSIVYWSDKMHERVEVGVAELKECGVEPLTDSSVCIRLQLANTAWAMFRAHPWTGGGEHFRDALHGQMQQGQVSEYVAANFGEPHNDFLYYLAAYGLLGLAGAILFIYLAPAWCFWRFFRINPDNAGRVAAAMGLAVCLGFAAFGQTEMMFRSMRTASLYAIWVAVLLTLAAPRRVQAEALP